MSNNALATRHQEQGSIIEQVIAKGDLKALDPMQRASYYTAVCQSMGLNPLTQPLQYIELNGKLTLYAGKGATDQLRNLHKVNVRIVSREEIGDLYVVTAEATMPDGRTDSEIGAVNVGGLKGDQKANAMMKASTKAKRRVTLSIVGLGMLDESELDTIRGVQYVRVDDDGVIQEEGPTQRALSAPTAEPEPEDNHELEIDELPFDDAFDTPDEDAVPPPQSHLAPPSRATATDKQVKAIYAIGQSNLGFSKAEIDRSCVDLFGRKPHELSRWEASQYIDSLKGQVA